MTLSGSGTPVLSAISCSNHSIANPATYSCTVTLNAAAPSEGMSVSLASSSAAVTVPAKVTVLANATTAAFKATVFSVIKAQVVTLNASAAGVSRNFSLMLNAAPATRLTVTTSRSPSIYGSAVTFTATMPSGPTGNITFYDSGANIGAGTINKTVATLTTGALTAGSHVITASWPGNSNYSALTSAALTQAVNKATPAITWNTPSSIRYGIALGNAQLDATSKVAGTFSYSPTSGTVLTAGTHTIKATFTPTNTTNYATATDSVAITVYAALRLLSCSSGTITGAGSDTCTVSLTAAAPGGGLTVNLSSSDSTVRAPSTVTIPAGVASAEFTATVTSVVKAKTATITASVGGMFTSYTMQLNATILALTINPASVAFGKVVVNAPTTQRITLTSTGTAPVTINGITLTGAGFKLSRPTLPLKLTPKQATTVDISFDPAAAGFATSQLTVTSNSSTGGTAVIGVSGTGAPPVAVSVTPASASTNAGTTKQFAASVTGATNTAVTWTVSGSGCSGITCGTISSSGLYATPPTAPSPATATITATSVSDPTQFATATLTIVPAAGATYYLAPAVNGGNDSNGGVTPSTPWLTPNHALNCGDVIVAAASSSYSASNFASGEWGTVSCPANNNVAWLKCATFDACKISVTSGTLDGMRVSASYWGVQGWEVSDTSTNPSGGSCFTTTPATPTGNIHHVIFANNVANVCPLAGFGSGNTVTAGVDYIAIVGNIAYGAGGADTWCGSGIGVYEPVASDTLPGTHIYVAGNLSYLSTNPVGCYDGNGIIFDTFDGSQTPMKQTYTQQGVIDNNISLSNGGVGVRMEYNDAGAGSSHAPIIARHNTTWNNSSGSYQYGNPTCGEFQLYETETTQAYLNLAVTNQVGCYGASWNPLPAFQVSDEGSTSSVFNNLGWSASGSNSQALNSSSFTFGTSNVFGINPEFAQAVTPAAPSCGTASSVPNCMAKVVADFTPTTAAAVEFGYQMPSSTPTNDPLFPQWLCNVNLPAGLVTMGCLAQ